MCFPFIPHIYKSPPHSLESSFLTSMVNYPTFCLGSCSVQFSHSAVSNLCDPMDYSMPGFPIHYQLPEHAQMHVHQVSDASSHFILCHPLILLPSIFPSIRVISNKSVLCIRWPKYWTFSFSISISSFNEYSGLISFRMDCLDLLAAQGTLSITVQKQQFFGTQLYL